MAESRARNSAVGGRRRGLVEDLSFERAKRTAATLLGLSATPCPSPHGTSSDAPPAQAPGVAITSALRPLLRSLGADRMAAALCDGCARRPPSPSPSPMPSSVPGPMPVDDRPSAGGRCDGRARRPPIPIPIPTPKPKALIPVPLPFPSPLPFRFDSRGARPHGLPRGAVAALGVLRFRFRTRSRRGYAFSCSATSRRARARCGSQAPTPHSFNVTHRSSGEPSLRFGQTSACSGYTVTMM